MVNMPALLVVVVLALLAAPNDSHGRPTADTVLAGKGLGRAPAVRAVPPQGMEAGRRSATDTQSHRQLLTLQERQTCWPLIIKTGQTGSELLAGWPPLLLARSGHTQGHH